MNAHVIRRWLGSALLGLMLSACAAQAPKADLYQQFGERAGLEAVTDALIELILADEKIAPLFENTDMASFKDHFVDFICMTMDGPCTYEGLEMEEVHTGMEITKAEFNGLVEQLYDAMETCSIPRAAQNELIARLARLRGQVIER